MGSEAIIIPAMFLAASYVVFLITTTITSRLEIRSANQLQNKLVDRLGTVSELTQFLATDGGQKLLGAASRPTAGGTAHQRVLRAIQSGVVLLSVGIGIFAYLDRTHPVEETYQVIAFVGTIAAALGVGLLLSGWVSLRLSRRLGLIDGHPDDRATRDTAHST